MNEAEFRLVMVTVMALVVAWITGLTLIDKEPGRIRACAESCERTGQFMGRWSPSDGCVCAPLGVESK